MKLMTLLIKKEDYKQFYDFAISISLTFDTFTYGLDQDFKMARCTCLLDSQVFLIKLSYPDCILG